jgi:exocyst complex component 4
MELLPAGIDQMLSSPTSPPSTTPSRLNRFLYDLALRPNDAPHGLNEPSIRGSVSARGQSSGPASMPLLNSVTAASTARNPEADSFAYMETLLESLAVLGKIGNALDGVSQRLPGEIFSLVEATIEEVAERAEYSKRRSIFGSAGSTKTEGPYFYSSDPTIGMGLEMAQPNSLLKASCLRLTALESSAKQADHEILNDFFWTVYSKLDAVSQGLRLVYEVANRIGSVSGQKPRRFHIPEHAFHTLVTETGFQRFIWNKARCPFPTS